MQSQEPERGSTQKCIETNSHYIMHYMVYDFQPAGTELILFD